MWPNGSHSAVWDCTPPLGSSQYGPYLSVYGLDGAGPVCNISIAHLTIGRSVATTNVTTALPLRGAVALMGWGTSTTLNRTVLNVRFEWLEFFVQWYFPSTSVPS